MASAMSRSADWTRAMNLPYDLRGAGHGRGEVSEKKHRNMHESSGSGRLGIKLGGDNLSLGRGAARVHILKDIDLSIGLGEAIGLVGPSGSGKSTLLMVMAGLERPDTGSVV